MELQGQTDLTPSLAIVKGLQVDLAAARKEVVELRGLLKGAKDYLYTVSKGNPNTYGGRLYRKLRTVLGEGDTDSK